MVQRECRIVHQCNCSGKTQTAISPKRYRIDLRSGLELVFFLDRRRPKQSKYEVSQML